MTFPTIYSISYRKTKAKPHHPNFAQIVLLLSGSAFQLRPNDRLSYLTIQPKPEFW